MNKIIKKIIVLCLTMCSTITLRTHCMLAQMLAGKQKFGRHPQTLLRKKVVLSQSRFRLLFRQHRFYNAGVEVTNAQILLAVEETNRKMDAILNEIRKQSLQTPVITPVTTMARNEADYNYKPNNRQPNEPSEPDLSQYNMHYGNR